EGHSVARMFSQFRRSRSRILVTWDKVRVPAGEDILVLAVGLARDKPLTLRNPISKNYSRVVSIAAHLQNLRPGDYINLPVARLGEILGVNDRTISYYLQRGTRDGYLTRIARHHQPSGTAAKYTLAHGSSKLTQITGMVGTLHREATLGCFTTSNFLGSDL